MKINQLAMIALVGLGFSPLALSSPADADNKDGKETCASKYRNAPTQLPRGYEYGTETDAYMAFRRAALSAGYSSVKKVKRRKATEGPCVGYGDHWNMEATSPSTKGKSLAGRMLAQ